MKKISVMISLAVLLMSGNLYAQKISQLPKSKAAYPVLMNIPDHSRLKLITEPGFLYPDPDSDSVSCGKDDFIISQFSQIKDAISPDCWANKQSYNRLEEGTKVDDKMLLESDYAICGCLRSPKSNKNVAIRNIMGASPYQLPNFNPPQTVVEILEEKVKDIEKKITADRDGLALHATLISRDKNFHSAYYMDPVNDTKEQRAVQNEKDSYNPAKNLPTAYNEDGSPKVNLTIKEVLNRIEIPQKPVAGLFNETDFGPGQCFSAREFFSFRQLPLNKNLLNEIQNTDLNEFKEENWDYTVLKKKYAQLMKKSDKDKSQHKDEIMALKSKLIYLHRNPMIKLFFQAKNDSNFIKNSEKMSTTRKLKLGDYLDKNGSKINQQKKILFSILKNPVKDCKPANCSKEMISGGKDEALNEDLQKFFGSSLIGGLMEIESERQAHSRLAELNNFQAVKVNKKDLSQQMVVTEFVYSTGLKNPDNCTSGGVDVKQCVEIYSAYCKTLDTIIPNLQVSDGDSDLRDDYETITKNNFNPDFNTNDEFSKFNKEICEGPRASKKDSQGKSIKTLEKYIADLCSANPLKSECQNLKNPDNVIALRNSFLKEYPYSTATKPRIPDDLVIAFVNRLSKNPIATRVEAPVALASDSSRSEVFNDFARKWNLPETPEMGSSHEPLELPNSIASSASVTNAGTETDRVGYGSDSAVAGPMNYNQSGNNAFSQNAVAPSEKTQVENLSDVKRQEILDDWKDDYEDLKNSKKDESTADAEAPLKAKIEALEQLLAQQKRLTEDQYKLLNDAIAAQTKKPDVADEGSAVARNKAKTINELVKDAMDAERTRTPASIKESQFNTAGVASGTNAGATTGAASESAKSASRTSGTSAISDTSADSIAREEAKLVNYRRVNDGSILIESVKTGTGITGNAITLPVSDEQYAILVKNPNDLNLQMIEKSIPQDQITKLNKDGEILLILKNGEKSLEVKVEKINNRLVYRQKDSNGNANPVKRTYTRQALELQLKVQR